MSERIRGTVKFFKRDKGFGFIQREDGKDDVFVHYSGITAEEGSFRNLDKEDLVEFDVEASERGPRAANVVKIGTAQISDADTI